ncbi:hypothetical protein D3C72_2330570 [compost metagenome]
MGGDVGDQFCTRRGTVLVIDHAQAVTLRSQAQHGFGEIVAACGIHPAGAEDQVLATGSLDRLLAGQLAGAIGIQWVNGIVFAPRLGALPREHIVGGVMYQ